MEDNEDILIDDILSISKKKKKVNGKSKGARTERKLVKKLENRFGKGFSRSIGSGNRWSQAHLPKHAMEVFSGDLVVIEGFKWCFESKGGYDHIDLHNILESGKSNKEFDGFLSQAEKDGERCGRMPIVAWTRTRKPWLAILHTKELGRKKSKFPFRMNYKKWTIVQLDKLLELEDDFFLEEV